MVRPKAGKNELHDHQALLVVLTCAAILYGFRLGSWSLGGSEAYSALVASQSNVGAVVEQALLFDPGKPPLYQILLHWFAALFGSHETSLRAFSAIFALVAPILLYPLALSMFSPEAALAAVVIWAFNPLAFILGQWARMYSMFICTVVASMLSFWRVREQGSGLRIVIFAGCSTLMLYTHMCGLLFSAAQAGVLVRDTYYGRRRAAAWAGLALALVMFGPFLPTEIAEARGMLFTHWLDWIGPAHPVSSMHKIVTACAAGLAVVALIFGPRFESDGREPLRFCVIWLMIPLIAFAAASIIVRPVFSPRYAAPALPALALLLGRALASFSPRIRNLSAAGVAVVFAVLCSFYSAARYEPWRDVARQVKAAGIAEPVFFETGLVVSDGTAAETVSGFASGFPEGYFRVPFDYYFNGPNVRKVINPLSPASAREQIADAALHNGGAWLISGKISVIARAEMPNSDQFRIDQLLHHDYATLYHIVPLNPSRLLKKSSQPASPSVVSPASGREL
jgi:4-amino-4-deoxy-L-arabinose transferase-like glycosyltransferase